MDQDTRHWYLQQMGIPVWLPKDADSAVPRDERQIDDGLAASSAGPSVDESPTISAPANAAQANSSQVNPSQATPAPESNGAAERPQTHVSKPKSAAPGDAALDAPPAIETVSTQAGTASAADNAVAPNLEPDIWLVMPDVPATQKAAAEDLLNKILNAVEVPNVRCKMIWGLPDAMPAPTVKWVWCFGVQAPAGLQAQTLSLPSLADMLNSVEAKRHAWGLLKNSMPFG